MTTLLRHRGGRQRQVSLSVVERVHNELIRPAPLPQGSDVNGSVLLLFSAQTQLSVHEITQLLFRQRGNGNDPHCREMYVQEPLYASTSRNRAFL